MTHNDVQVWLDRYVAAWSSYDPVAIGELFAEEAEYRYHPWDEPVKGREAIVQNWVSDKDEPGCGRPTTTSGRSTGSARQPSARAATPTRTARSGRSTTTTGRSASTATAAASSSSSTSWSCRKVSAPGADHHSGACAHRYLSACRS